MNRRVVYLAGVAALLAPLTQSIYAPSMAVVRDDLGATNALAAATIAVYGVCLSLSQLVYGPLVDRYPPRRILLIALGAYVLASVGSFFAPTIVSLIAARGVQAFMIAATIVVAPALVSDLTPQSQRGAALGVYQFFVLIGPVAGPLIGSVVATVFNWRADFLVLAAAAAVVLVLVRSWLPDHRLPSDGQTTLALSLLAENPAALATSLVGFAQFFCMSAITAFLPILLRTRFGLAEIWIGPCLVALTLCMAIGSPFGGQAGDRYGRRLAIVVGVAGAAVFTGGLALIALVGASSEFLVPLLGALAGLGFAYSLGWGSQLALLVDSFPLRRGSAVASYNFCRFLGTAIGPFVTGALVDYFGIGYAFLVPFALLAIVALIAAIYVRQPADVAVSAVVAR